MTKVDQTIDFLLKRVLIKTNLLRLIEIKRMLCGMWYEDYSLLAPSCAGARLRSVCAREMRIKLTIM